MYIWQWEYLNHSAQFYAIENNDYYEVRHNLNSNNFSKD
jgi:hypothetical protein